MGTHDFTKILRNMALAVSVMVGAIGLSAQTVCRLRDRAALSVQM